jgi:hypothetical protein
LEQLHECSFIANVPHFAGGVGRVEAFDGVGDTVLVG